MTRSALAAFGLLTIVPLPGATTSPGGSVGHAIAFFPFVGLTLGVLVAAIDALLRTAIPIPAVTAMDLVVLAVATGGLHLDGLADAADGLFGASDREGRLAAMRDSRTGAFGAAALTLVILLEYAALSGAPPDGRGAVLITAAVASRWAMSLAVWAFRPARPDGLGAAFARSANTRDVAVAAAIAALVTAAISSGAIAAIVVSSLVALAIGGFTFQRLGGLTGDVYGAIGETAFACVLVALAARAV